MRKKYVRFIAVIIAAAFLCSIICSCNDAATQSQTSNLNKDVDMIEGNIQNENYKYLVVQSEGTDKKICEVFVNATEYGLYTAVEKKVFNEVEKSIISPFTSQRLDYQYSNCSKNKNEADSIDPFYSVYDVYNTERENLIYLHGTELLCQYFYREDSSQGLEMTLSRNEALEIANDFLLSFLSKDQIAKFEPPVINEEPSGTFMYTVSYVRKVAGFDTDETITVFISLSGKVVGYNGNNLDKYDSYVDTIKADKVNEAKKALETKIQSLNLSNCSIHFPIITTNTSGELFLMIDVEYSDDCGMTMVDSCLINIL